MQVCHVVRQFSPMIGGLEDAVSQLAYHLMRDHSIRSSVVTLNRSFGKLDQHLPRVGEYLGVPIQRISFRGSTRYPIAPSVLDALGNADIVHVHGVDFFFDYLSATRLWHRRPLVASTHGGFFHTDFASKAKRLWFATVTRASAQGYHRIFGSSESDAAMFRTIAPRQTITVENGVNISKWHGASSVEPQQTMIFIGRFSVNKDIISLIRLTAALGPPWRLLLAGQPSDLTADDIRASAAKLGVHNRVEVHSELDDTAIIYLLSRSSYVCSASRYEGFGLSVVEGLSAGLTPLLRPIAPFRRLVERTGRGLLLDMDDVAQAANVIHAHHENLDAESRFGNMAAATTFGWARVSGTFAAEYESVLNGSSISRIIGEVR